MHGRPGSGVALLLPSSSLLLYGAGCSARASRVLAACGPSRLCLVFLGRAVSQAPGRAGLRVVLICSILAAGGAAPGGGRLGLGFTPRSGAFRWSQRESVLALGGRRRLDPLFLGGAFGGASSRCGWSG